MKKVRIGADTSAGGSLSYDFIALGVYVERYAGHNRQQDKDCRDKYPDNAFEYRSRDFSSET